MVENIYSEQSVKRKHQTAWSGLEGEACYSCVGCDWIVIFQHALKGYGAKEPGYRAGNFQKICYAIQFSDLKVIYNVDMSKYEWVYI